MSRQKQKKLAGPGWWSHEKKVQTVTTYLAVGNAPMTEAVTGVPKGTIRQWKMQQWWKELEADIRNEEDAELDVKLTKIIDKSLDAVLDRVEHGDFLWDSKSNKFVRKPVHMKDALNAVTQVFDKRNLLRGKPTSRVEKQNVNDNLAKLAAEFAKFAAAKEITGEVLAEDIGTISESIASQGDAEEQSLCSGDESTPEGGRPETEQPETDLEGSDQREHDASPTSEGSGSQIFGQSQTV